MRQGEILGLRWSDIDADSPRRGYLGACSAPRGRTGWSLPRSERESGFAYPTPQARAVCARAGRPVRIVTLTSTGVAPVTTSRMGEPRPVSQRSRRPSRRLAQVTGGPDTSPTAQNPTQGNVASRRRTSPRSVPAVPRVATAWASDAGGSVAKGMYVRQWTPSGWQVARRTACFQTTSPGSGDKGAVAFNYNASCDLDGVRATWQRGA